MKSSKYRKLQNFHLSMIYYIEIVYFCENSHLYLDIYFELPYWQTTREKRDFFCMFCINLANYPTKQGVEARRDNFRTNVPRFTKLKRFSAKVS